ncbi:ATP-binding protein [Pelagicoccus albus]|uniref:histidine kinase n=1 Tax=Pelagicoccus albus TaxID=415222 RepID=A0A7X1E6R4_9BACT|nr:ATP-binding protein [Pelagicoccus albus]MBC2604549.1 response regulator [Pelagicoccus albus]
MSIPSESSPSDPPGLFQALDRHAIVAITDHRGVITYANENFCRVSQYSKDELLGRTHKILNSGFHPKSFWANFWSVIRRGEIWEGEICNRAKDGSLFWLLTTISPVLNDAGDIVSYISIRTDHTRSKNRKLRFDLAESVGKVGTWEMAFSNRRVDWDDKMYEMHGVKQEVGDLFGAWLELVYPDDRESFRSNLLGIEKGTRKIALDYRLKSEDGFLRRFGLVGNVVYDTDGTRLSLVGVVVDKTIEYLQRSELAAATEDAKRSNLAKSRFLANMGHELLTPLNGIIGMASLLQVTSEVTEEQGQMIGSIESSGKSLLKMVESILDFTQIESGDIKLANLDFELAKTLQEVSDIYSVKAKSKGLGYTWKLAPSLPRFFRGDTARLKQILMEVLDNAVKFTESGEISLYVQKIGSIGGETVVNFTVRDTGIGVPEAQLQKVFDGFAQVDDKTSRSYGGTGLGLARVKRILDLMDGTIRLDSVEGEGTTVSFSIVFDAVKSSRVLNAPKELSDRSCLLVSKNMALREQLESVLSVWSVNTGACSKAALALELIKSRIDKGMSLDYVIFDSNNEGMPASEFAARLEDIMGAAGVKLIFIDSDLFGIETGLDIEVLFSPLRQSSIFDALVSGVGSASYIDMEDMAYDENCFENRSKRVLVVEDNSSNQIVIEAVLEKLGISPVCVRNGIEAITALNLQAFDLIFMDIQMPELNGVEATKVIRSGDPSKWDPHVSIVALTANTRFKDRAACFEAGMDDFISKPVEVSEVYRVLERLLPPLEQEEVEEGGSNSQEDGKLFDGDYLLQSLDGDLEFVRGLLKDSIVSIEGESVRFGSLLKLGQFEEANKCLHKLKGAAGNLRCVSLFEECVQIQNLLERDQVGRAVLRLDLFQQLVDQTMQELKAV